MQFHGLPWHQKNLDDNARKEERAAARCILDCRGRSTVLNFRLIRLIKYGLYFENNIKILRSKKKKKCISYNTSTVNLG